LGEGPPEETASTVFAVSAPRNRCVPGGGGYLQLIPDTGH